MYPSPEFKPEIVFYSSTGIWYHTAVERVKRVSEKSIRKKLLILTLVFGLFLVMGAVAGGGRSHEKSLFDELPVHFSMMKYVSPDVDRIGEHISSAVAAAENNVSYSKICSALDVCMEDYHDFQTAYALADIYSRKDMTDEYWAEQYSLCMETESLIEQLFDELYYACAACGKAQRLERDYFWDGFREEYSDPEESLYTDESVALMQQEAGLLSEYHSIVASPVITVDGEERDLWECLDECGQDDYWDTLMLYYYTYNEELSDIYIKLIGVRRELAEVLGYDSYRDMQFDYFFSRDYTPEQAEKYTEDIRRWAVPLYRQHDGYYSSYQVMQEDLRDIVGGAARKMGGQIGKTYDFMEQYGLFDLRFDNRKANMSFTTYIDNYESPFILLDPEESERDILTFVHELGHATDTKYNYNADESIDLAEVFSQSMEYLMPAYMTDTLDSDTIDELYRLKMWDTLESYVQQASFAEFENRVYAMSEAELTAENLNALSLELAEEYGYLTPGYEDYFAMSWIDIVHFFEYPFYVISYPVSCDVALQIYEMEQAVPGAGVDKFYALLPRGEVTLVAAAEDAGLVSPFEEGRVEKAVKDIAAKLR